MKFKSIIKESFESFYDNLKTYIKVFKFLNRRGFKSGEIETILIFLTKEMEFKLNQAFDFALLYDKNYREDGNYESIKPKEWILPTESNISDEQFVAAKHLKVPPLMLELTDNESYKMGNGKTFVPVAKFSFLNRIQHINVLPYDSVMNEAKRNLIEKIEDRGWEYYDGRYNTLQNFIELKNKVVYYDAEEAAEEEFERYLSRSGSSRESYKQGLLEDIGLVDEYLDAKEYIEEILEVINGLKSENQQLTHKMRRIEKEIKIIELEMERLVDVVDYGEDDEEYHSMYTEDIYELEEKLRKLESKYDELYNEMDDNNKSISELEIDSSYYYDIYEKYNNEESFKKIFIKEKTEQLAEIYFNNPMDYLEESGYTIDSAIDDGVINFDKHRALNNIIKNREVTEFLDGFEEGKYKSVEVIYDDDYIIFKKTLYS